MEITAKDRELAERIGKRMIGEQWEDMRPTNVAAYPIRCRRCGGVEFVTIQSAMMIGVEEAVQSAKDNHVCLEKVAQ